MNVNETVEALRRSHGGQRFVAKNWRRVDSQGLYKTNFCLTTAVAEGYGYVEGNGKTYQGHWYVYHDGTGVFINRGWADKSPNYCEVQFFAWGCDHSYERTKNLGNCYNRYTCCHCGHVMDVDSSD